MYKESVESAIKRLENINANSDLAYEEAILAFVSIKKLPVLIYRFEEPFHVHRARTHENDEFYTDFSEIGLTPKRFVSGFARCNKPTQSVFYCAENRPTAFMELVDSWVDKTQPGDEIFVTLGRWMIKKPFQVALITTPDKENRKDEFDIEHGVALDEFINGINDKDEQEYVLKGLKEEIEKIDKLTDYSFLRKEILIPTINHSVERKYITDVESKILKKVIDMQVIQAGDVKEFFVGKLDSEVSRQIKKLIDKKMLVPEKEGTRKYIIRFDNNYLLRGVIKSLGEKGFLPFRDEV